MDIETIAIPFTLTMFSIVCTLPDVSFGFIFLMFFTVFVVCFVAYHISYSTPVVQKPISLETLHVQQRAFEDAFNKGVNASMLDCSEAGAGSKMSDRLECRATRDKAIDMLWKIINISKKYPESASYEEKQTIILESFTNATLKPWKSSPEQQS